MNEEYYQELNRLKDLSPLPSVQKVLQGLINERHQDIREPIKRSKVNYYYYYFGLLLIYIRQKSKQYILLQVMLGVKVLLL